MATTWFTSDLHLGHERILQHARRPFHNIGDHDRAILDNWNDRVTKDEDIVWVLGDYTIEGSTHYGLQVLKKFKGRKRLIMGNHDRCWVARKDGTRHLRAYLEAGFEMALPWATANVGKTTVNLSHFPYVGDHTREDRYEPFRLRESNIPLLHGHLHSKDRVTEAPYVSGWTGDQLPIMGFVKQINVGVDAWDFSPVASHELQQYLMAPATPVRRPAPGSDYA